jgi:hypothetical protein
MLQIKNFVPCSNIKVLEAHALISKLETKTWAKVPTQEELGEYYRIIPNYILERQTKHIQERPKGSYKGN